MTQLTRANFNKDTSSLETLLNNFFYGKQGETFNKYYDRASDLAMQAFNEKYSSYPFELVLDKMSAKFTHPTIRFIKRDDDLNQIKQIATEIQNWLDQQGLQSDEKLKIIQNIQKLQSISEWKDVSSLNGIVASIMFGNKTVYGDAFEYPLAALSALISQGVDATEEDLLKEFSNNALKGQSRSTSTLNISKLSKADKKQLNIKNSIIINDGLEMKYSNPTQDKIDVVLNLNGETFNISAKSYASIYKNIHILGGTPLSVPVLNLSSVDFVSHYLTELYKENGDLFSIHEAVRLNILFMSLTGSEQSKQEADTFVINDKGHRRIFVRSMSDIIHYIANSNKWSNVMINGNSIEIPDTPLRNYQKVATENKMKHCIGNMISLMHAQKLSVSIKGTTVRDSNVN